MLMQRPLEMIRGDTFSFTVSCEGATLSGVTMTVRDRTTDEVIFSQTGTSITGGYSVTLAPSKTTGVTPGVYKYDVQVTTTGTGAGTYTPLFGAFIITEDQTR